MYRIGIVGCGGIAQVHAAAISKIDGLKLVACADIKPDRAQALAEKYGARPYASMEDMLEKEQLDAVHLCTPHCFHTPMAQLAAEKGLPVFTEKPPVISFDQWEALKEAGNKIPIGVCFQNRYNPNVREAMRIIESKEFGERVGARAVVTWHREAPYYVESGWRGKWATEGGGALINQSIHTLDLLIRLMGRAEKIECHMANHHLQNVIEVEDTVDAYLEMGGKPVLFFATTAYTQNAPIFVEIELERATLRLDTEKLEIITPEGKEERTFELPETLGKGYWGNGHVTCIHDFYQSLSSGSRFQNDLASVEDTVNAMLTMYEQGKKYL